MNKIGRKAVSEGRSVQTIGSAAIQSNPRKSALGAQPMTGRKYASPAQLAELYPYSEWSWRGWYYAGRLNGCLKPAGKRGRLLIPVDEADRVMREGLPVVQEKRVTRKAPGRRRVAA